MAEASKSMTMKVSREALMKVITDYESYPKFVQGVSSAKILHASDDGRSARVAYAIEIMGKAINYTLDHEVVGEGLTWKLVESNLMKENSGGWEIKGKDGALDVTYTVKLDLNFSVPGFIMKGLVASGLPTLMSSFEARAR
jgi:ribosome-associated toxin RatA of RatAB toxin-antitoxin module